MRPRLNQGGARSVLLIERSYAEEGRRCPPIDETVEPTILLFPRSFIERSAALPGEKAYDYCFVGSLYHPATFARRRWILDFARERFSEASYFLVTIHKDRHASLGVFDYTHQVSDVFVPRLHPADERAFFHEHYFEVLRRSCFTLCPAGDAPWSMRFFEAIMCQSIPIVSDRKHAGRNGREREIGYKFYTCGEEHVYRTDWAADNYDRFLRHQTLIDNPSEASR
jgi:Exostosin family